MKIKQLVTASAIILFALIIAITGVCGWQDKWLSRISGGGPKISRLFFCSKIANQWTLCAINFLLFVKSTFLKSAYRCYKSSVFISPKKFGFDFPISMRPDDFYRKSWTHKPCLCCRVVGKVPNPFSKGLFLKHSLPKSAKIVYITIRI